MTEQVELRLRRALHARAGQITQERLSLGVPPTVAAPRPPLRLWRWLPVPAGATIAAVALGIALSSGSSHPDPVLPGGPAIITPTLIPSAPTGKPGPSAATTDPEPAGSSSASVRSTPSRSGKPKPATAVPGSSSDTKAPDLPPEATPAG